MSPEVSIIVAYSRISRAIGKLGELPWEFKIDFQYFQRITTVTIDPTKINVVIMGRKTWESIPLNNRPLKNRVNVIISKTLKTDPILNKKEWICDDNLELVIQTLLRNKHIENIFIIGGSEIYTKALELNLVDKVLATVIHKEFLECDTFFPELSNEFVIESEKIVEESGIVLGFEVFKKKIIHEEYQYLNLVREILNTGNLKGDRTGTGTKSVFGRTMKFSLRNQSFPLLTTKRTFWKGVAVELLWFISGSTNANILKNQGVNIWEGNSTREYLDSIGLVDREEGDLGPVYGFQWRHFGSEYKTMHDDYTNKGIDQLTELIDLIKKDPNSRRLIMCAWNPVCLKQMVLPPCFPAGTLILTNNGYKEIQNVEKTDLMFTHKGNWKHINNLQTKNYDGDMYELQIGYNTKKIKVTSEHPFYVRDIKRKPNKTIDSLSEPYWCDAKNLKINEHTICLPINKESIIPVFKIEKGMNQNSIKTITKNIENSNEWFMMGYFMGDGWADHSDNGKNRFNFVINKKQEYIFDIISKITNMHLKSETDKIWIYECSNKIWWEILKQFGHLAHNKIIPEWVQIAPVNCIEKFIEGYTAADGCIIKEKRCYTTVSCHIAYGLQRLYAKLGKGLSVNYQIRPPTKIIEGKTVNQRNTFHMIEIIPQNNSFQLLIDENYINFPVKNIQFKKEITTVYNFEVADDNSYTVQNLSVHNCHVLCQFYVCNGELSCQMYQRSADMGLGVPFNIASYALLTCLIAQCCNLACGDLIHVIGDCHVYLNHEDALLDQLKNVPNKFPTLKINSDITDITKFKFEDLELVNYNPHKSIKMKMAV
jgi:dihydrofolate reductase/thymidylate synthase